MPAVEVKVDSSSNVPKVSVKLGNPELPPQTDQLLVAICKAINRIELKLGMEPTRWQK